MSRPRKPVPADVYRRRWRLLAAQMSGSRWARRHEIAWSAERLFRTATAACGNACATALLDGRTDQALAWAEATRYFDRQHELAFERAWHRNRAAELALTSAADEPENLFDGRRLR